MTINKYFLTFALVLAPLLSAQAHDPRLHEPTAAPTPAPKAKPATCAQLADTDRYSTDVSDADIKALKDRCGAGKSSSSERPAKKSG